MSKRLARLMPSLRSWPFSQNTRGRRERTRDTAKSSWDVAQLEDRILLSATPIDPDMLDGAEAEAVSAFVDADVEIVTNEAVSFQLLEGEFLLDANAAEHDDSHFDMFGNEFHALPVPIDSQGSGDSIDLTETGDGLVALSDTFNLHSNLGA